jgi:hypothetical protein
MDFVSIRVITDDVARLAGFYEKATGVRATWYTEDFAELGPPTPSWRSAAPAPSRCSRPAPPARPTTAP